MFRGLPDYEYSPVNRLERIFHDNDIPYENWHDLESGSLAFFKEHAREHIALPPPDNDLIGWLSIMQHYGAPTRLTDWTSSPFVACYFAFESVGNSGGDASLWVLNAGALRAPFGWYFPTRRDHLGIWTQTISGPSGKTTEEFIFEGVTDETISKRENDRLRGLMIDQDYWPYPVPIFRPDKRMTAQQACFVTSGRLLKQGESTIKELLMSDEFLKSRENPLARGPTAYTMRENEKGDLVEEELPHPFTSTQNIVKKVRLPHTWKADINKTLLMMNITGDTIYPGLDGVGRATEAFINSGGFTLSLRDFFGI